MKDTRKNAIDWNTFEFLLPLPRVLVVKIWPENGLTLNRPSPLTEYCSCPLLPPLFTLIRPIWVPASTRPVDWSQLVKVTVRGPLMVGGWTRLPSGGCGYGLMTLLQPVTDTVTVTDAVLFQRKRRMRFGKLFMPGKINVRYHNIGQEIRTSPGRRLQWQWR